MDTLSLIVIFILLVILICLSGKIGLIIIIGAAVIWWLMGTPGLDSCLNNGKKKENLAAQTTAPPGAGEPYIIPATIDPNWDTPKEEKKEDFTKYKGAIDYQTPYSEYAEYRDMGHLDEQADEWKKRPIGNPYNIGRTDYPNAAEACEDDYAAAISDADELSTYQNTTRNGNDRAIAGVIRQKPMLDFYVRQELDEREDCRWWGVHET